MASNRSKRTAAPLRSKTPLRRIFWEALTRPAVRGGISFARWPSGGIRLPRRSFLCRCGCPSAAMLLACSTPRIEPGGNLQSMKTFFSAQIEASVHERRGGRRRDGRSASAKTRMCDSRKTCIRERKTRRPVARIPELMQHLGPPLAPSGDLLTSPLGFGL